MRHFVCENDVLLPETPVCDEQSLFAADDAILRRDPPFSAPDYLPPPLRISLSPAAHRGLNSTAITMKLDTT